MPSKIFLNAYNDRGKFNKFGERNQRFPEILKDWLMSAFF